MSEAWGFAAPVVEVRGTLEQRTNQLAARLQPGFGVSA